MAKAEFVLSAKRNIYKRGRKVQYVSKRGKKAGQTLTKIDRFQPADEGDEVLIHAGESYYTWCFYGGQPIYSKTKMASNMGKIVITHGAASSITVNSMKVIVASDANFTNVVSELTPTFVANGSVTVNRPAGADWSNCYYKIVYNVSVSGNTNRYIQFVKAEFTAN